MRWPVLVTTLVVAGCSGGGTDDGDDTAPYDCSLEEDADTFVVGLEKISPSGIHFQLMASIPAPPARGDNHFTVHLADAAGAPLTGAALSVVQYMPLHGHGSAVPVIITESTAVPGEYDVNPVNFHMNKLWHVIMSTSASESDRVTFAFCIP
jgi:hypothetical protein